MCFRQAGGGGAGCIGYGDDLYAFGWARGRRGCVFGVSGGRKRLHVQWTEVRVPAATRADGVEADMWLEEGRDGCQRVRSGIRQGAGTVCVRVGGCSGSFSVGLVDASDLQVACAQPGVGPCQGHEWEGGSDDWNGARFLVYRGADGDGSRAEQCDESGGIDGDGAGQQLPGSHGMYCWLGERWRNGNRQ